MTIKLTIKREIQIKPDDLEEKIEKYLNTNFYRITEKGQGYIIFIDDEFSDRKSVRSDVHTRIGEGKFLYEKNEEGTVLKLVYLTPVLYPFIIMVLFAFAGVYVESIIPIFMSFAFLVPLGHRIYYLNEHIFDEILDF